MKPEDIQSEKRQHQKITDGAEINEDVNWTLPLSDWDLGGEIWSYSLINCFRFLAWTFSK